MNCNLLIDIGATKTDISIHKNFEICNIENFKNKYFKNILEIIQDYKKKYKLNEIDCIAIAGAGPIINDSIKLTNIDWEISKKYINNKIKFKKFILLNDMQAHAYSVLNLKKSDLYILKNGIKKNDNITVLAAGTGLGQSALIKCYDDKYTAINSEGAHAKFSPKDKEDIEILNFLLKKNKYISWEDVISGKYGFNNTLNYLNNKFNLNIKFKKDNIGENIFEMYKNNSKIAKEIFRIFVKHYANEAANMALRFYSLGGVYICGGIAPKMIDIFVENNFEKQFADNGRFSNILKNIPVYIIKRKHNALYGLVFCIMKNQLIS